MSLIQCLMNNILVKQCLSGNSKYEFMSMRDLVRETFLPLSRCINIIAGQRIDASQNHFLKDLKIKLSPKPFPGNFLSHIIVFNASKLLIISLRFDKTLCFRFRELYKQESDFLIELREITGSFWDDFKPQRQDQQRV